MSEQSGGPGWWFASDGKWYPPVPPPPPGAPDGLAPSSGKHHYDATVNKGSLNMATFTIELNRRWGSGWRLAHMIEQKGNTVLVWERRD